MSLVALSEIKTVTQLYQDQSLTAVTSTAAGAVSVKSNPSYNNRIGLIRGDITKLKVDVIVNAANNSLLGGGGVDGAIHAGAGPKLLKECAKLKGCRTGSAKITEAYELPCKKVIHAVGPIYNPRRSDDCENDLRGCYRTSLELATEHGCKSIAFSALSTGVYGYPSNDAAPVAIRTVKEFLESENGSMLEKVIFCTFVTKDVDAYNRWIPHFFPPAEEEHGGETEQKEVQDTEEPQLSGAEDTPSAPTDLVEDDWEEVTGGESAENGPSQPADNVLSDVPQTEDAPEKDQGEPATKKHKSTK